MLPARHDDDDKENENFIFKQNSIILFFFLNQNLINFILIFFTKIANSY